MDSELESRDRSCAGMVWWFGFYRLGGRPPLLLFGVSGIASPYALDEGGGAISPTPALHLVSCFRRNDVEAWK